TIHDDSCRAPARPGADPDGTAGVGPGAGSQRQGDPDRRLQLVLGAAGLHRRADHQVRRRPLLQGGQRRRGDPRPDDPDHLLRRRLPAPGRGRQHQEARRAGQDLRGHHPARVTDGSAQIAKLHAAKPEVTFLVLVPGPGAQALIERQKIGWTDTLMVSTGPLTDERYLALAGDAAEGVEGLSLWPDPLLSDLAGVKRYREHMQKYFPKNGPNRYSIAGYFAAMLFTEGAKRAGRNLTRESLIAALESIKGYESGILPSLTIGADHETQKRGLWVRVEKGRFKPLTDWLKSE